MIMLKYFERTDFDKLKEWIDSPEFLLQWGGPSFKYPLTAEQLDEYIKGSNNNDSNIYIYKVYDCESNNVVGHISLGNIDRVNKSGRIGRVLVGDKNVRGKGIGELMMREILRIAFEELKLHRVDLGVFDFNKSAIACYEKVGFVKEGLRRDYRKIGDEYWNLWEMSILENEWKA